MLRSFQFGSPHLCAYCGVTPTTRDHVIPFSGQTLRSCKRFTDTGPWTYACHQCNSILADRHFNTFDDRCRFLSSRLNSQAKPVLWSNAELQELDVNLRDYIARDQLKRRIQREQADWYQSRDYWLNLESLQWLLLPEDQHLQAYFTTTIGLLRSQIYKVECA